MEKRAFEAKLEVRSAPGGPELFGRVFGFAETPDGHFGKERFSPDCKISYGDKVFLLRDHDQTKILARRGRNLKIEKDSEGVNFTVSRLPDTSLAKETKTLIKEGLLDGASVGFVENESHMERDTKVFTDIKIHEVSLVPTPYYESSRVEARAKKQTHPRPPELYD